MEWPLEPQRRPGPPFVLPLAPLRPTWPVAPSPLRDLPERGDHWLRALPARSGTNPAPRKYAADPGVNN